MSNHAQPEADAPDTASRDIRDRLIAEANRRYGPEGWRVVSVVFDLGRGNSSVETIHNLAGEPLPERGEGDPPG